MSKINQTYKKFFISQKLFFKEKKKNLIKNCLNCTFLLVVFCALITNTDATAIERLSESTNKLSSFLKDWGVIIVSLFTLAASFLAYVRINSKSAVLIFFLGNAFCIWLSYVLERL